MVEYTDKESLIKYILSAPRSGVNILLVNVNNQDNYRDIVSQYDTTSTIYLHNFSSSDNRPHKFQCYEKIKHTQRNTLVLGFSPEILTQDATNQDIIINELCKLEADKSAPPHTVVILFYKNATLLKRKISRDLRLDSKLILLEDQEIEERRWNQITFVSKSLVFHPKEQVEYGYEKYLAKLEQAPASQLIVQTQFCSAQIPRVPQIISCLHSSYEYLTKVKKLSKSIPEDALTDDEWATLLKRIDTKTVSEYLSKTYAGKRLSDLFLEFIDISNINNRWEIWLQMKNLQMQGVSGNDTTSFLYHVLTQNSSYQTLLPEYFLSLTKVNLTDEMFESWYDERKKGLANIHRHDQAFVGEQVSQHKYDLDHLIPYLTSNTLDEKRVILEWLSEKETLDTQTKTVLQRIYPELMQYLTTYDYTLNQDLYHNPELASDLTKYFEEYKINKVTNSLPDGFVQMVEQFANTSNGKHPYFSLPSRNSIIDSLERSENNYYCFIDNFGVEYLGYIISFCKLHNLSYSIQIAYADIPTKTENNKEFATVLPGCVKVDGLDEIKHEGGTETLDPNLKNVPYYIADELEWLERMFIDLKQKAATVNKVIIVTDHGSSRLAVLSQKLEKSSSIKVNSSSVHERYAQYLGEDCHSENYILSSNDFSAWTNYNRFSVQGAASWETHGGASIEEIVVPVITIYHDNLEYKVECLSPDIKLTPLSKEIIVNFGISRKCTDVLLKLDDRTYSCIPDGNAWATSIPRENLKDGSYVADVLVSGKKIGTVAFSIVAGMKKTNLLSRR